MADQTEQEQMLSIIQNRVERASHGKWTACRMTHAERGGDLTPEELGEYVMNSVRKSAEASGSSTFLFISVEKADGQPADVCHVGNGPTSPQNADFIQHAPDDVRYLLALLRERDAQIARKETALNMWRGWAHFVYLKGGPITLDDEALRAAVCVVHDDETATLRAERDDARAACMEWDRLHKRAIAERDVAQQEIEREQAATRQQQESASRLAVALAGRVGELLALQRAATGVVAGATEWWRECPWCRRANYQNAPAHFVDCPLEALRAALSADVETERSDFASFREHHLATEQAWEAEKQVVARLSAQVEQQERANQIIREEGVEARAIIQSRDIEIVKLNRVVDTLRAERDAAQQQIATLTEENAELLRKYAEKVG